MAEVWPDAVKLYYEGSKAARAQIEALLDKYRTNTSTLLALASAAVAFFGLYTGPRQQFCYWISIGSYVLAVATSFLIFKPIPTRSVCGVFALVGAVSPWSSQASSPRTLPSSRSTNGAASALWGHVNAWVNATVAGVTSNCWSVEAESWASDLPAKRARRRV